MPIAPAQALDPLATTPSLLAQRDLRRRIQRHLGSRLDQPEVAVQLLALDPFALLRGLRAVHAPLYGGSAPSQWAAPGLARALGPSTVRHLLAAPEQPAAGTSALRRLWLHSLATACAARELAAQASLLEPDLAWVLGLLHDLPHWVALTTPADAAPPDPQVLVARWQLPEPFQALAVPLTEAPDTPTRRLLLAAELLAELADFRHPGQRDDDGGPFHAVPREDLLAARQVRREVRSRLQAIGLDVGLLDADALGCPSEVTTELPAHPSYAQDLVLNVLSCAGAESYRSIVTALTAAAVRYGGYDRACFLKWNRATGRLHVRSKADSSARRMVSNPVPATADELAALQEALQDGRPVRVGRAVPTDHGLLHTLAVDECLLVPVNRDFGVPAFLALDRGLSAGRLQLVADAAAAATLGLAGSLLTENLLLRRGRQRAQHTALIDPLTRLWNRRMAIQVIDQELARAHRSEQPLSVLLCDLDHFKRLNDRHGHLQGDRALRATAQVLRQTMRRTDAVCRYGGEEFLVVLPDTGPGDATVLATRLFTAVEALGTELGLPLTISIGLTSRRPDDTVDTLLHRADHALYASKGHGRNRISVDAEDPDPASP